MIFNHIKALNIFRRGNPRYVVFNVTSRCNARCIFCHYWKQVEDKEAKKNELTLEKIQRIAKKYGNIVKLEIAGGEPFVRKDLFEIVDIFNRYTHPIIVDIPTNGTMPNETISQTEKILKRSTNILEIQLSFQGDRKIHDEVVQVKGAFDRILQTYKGLAALRENFKRLKIKLNLVYFSGNRDRILELLRFTEKEMKLDRFAITYPHGKAKEIDLYKGIENYKEYCKLSNYVYENFSIADKKDLHTILFRAIKYVMDGTFEHLMEEGSLGAYCLATKKMLVLGETGNVFPCEGKWELLGNLRDYDYDTSKILASEKTKRFRKENLGKDKCHCSWGNAVLCGIIHNPRYYPTILFNMAKLLLRRKT